MGGGWAVSVNGDERPRGERVTGSAFCPWQFPSWRVVHAS